MLYIFKFTTHILFEAAIEKKIFQSLRLRVVSLRKKLK